MIHTIPKEVLRIITDNLNFDDKLNLCMTCHNLYQKISKTNLYEALIVRKNTEDVIRLFQDQILDGDHVRMLDIEMDDLSNELYSNLADIFPNVTRIRANGNMYLTYKGGYVHEKKKREDHIILPLLKWKNTIKTYDSVNDWIHFRNALFCSTFPRLEYIDIWKSTLFPERKAGFDPLFLSKGIANAPMLTKLHLERSDLSINSLEEIHNGCPHIRSLKFKDVIIIIDKHMIPSSIIPANSVIRLELVATCFDKYGLFLDYILYKYTSLQLLDIFIDNYDLSRIEDRLVDYYPNYKTTTTGYSEDQNKPCRNRMNELEPTLKCYREGGQSFLIRLPKSIKTLILQSDMFDDAIEPLSKAGIALSILQLNDPNAKDKKSSVKSDQLEFFKNLNLLNSLTTDMESVLQNYTIDFVSDTITSLNIRLIDGGFYIDWLISMFPSLEVLRIRSEEYLLVNKKYNNGEHLNDIYPKMRKLELWWCKIHPESLTFLKTALPNVKEIIWRAYINTGNGYRIRYNMDFTGWNLLKLSVTMGFNNHRLLKFYTVISAPTKTIRFIKKYYSKGTLPIQGEPDFVEDAARVDIVCDYIDDLSVNNIKIDLNH